MENSNFASNVASVKAKKDGAKPKAIKLYSFPPIVIKSSFSSEAIFKSRSMEFLSNSFWARAIDFPISSIIEVKDGLFIIFAIFVSAIVIVFCHQYIYYVYAINY